MKLDQTTGIVFARIGLYLLSCKQGADSLLSLSHGKTGEGIISAGFALMYILLAISDLGAFWGARNSSMEKIMRSSLVRPSLLYRLCAFLVYCLFAIGIYLKA